MLCKTIKQYDYQEKFGNKPEELKIVKQNSGKLAQYSVGLGSAQIEDGNSNSGEAFSESKD